MAYIQQNTPPPNKILTFSLTDFSGGLNNRANILEANQCSDVLNMSFSNDTVMEKRFGSTAFDALLLSGELTFIDEFKPYQEADIMIRASKTEMYVGNTKVKDLIGQVTGTNFNGKYFFSDGSGLYAYGKFAQTGGTYVTITGTPISTYTIMQIVSPAIGYTPLDTTHVEGKTVYNYTLGTVHYEPCANELSDTFKGTSVVPFQPRFIVVKDGRLFTSGSNKDNDNVNISDVNNPYYFPAVMPIQLPPNSDEVVGMHVYDGAVVVGRRRDIHVIHGVTNRTDMGLPVFELKKLNSHAGFANHYAVDTGHNYLFFLGSDGNAYLLNNVAGNQNVISSQIMTKSINIFEHPISLTKADMSDASSLFFEDNWYLTIKDKVLVYSYRHQAWTMYDSLHARSFYNFHNILIWGDKFGRTSIPSTDYLDYGTPFRAHWTSRQFDMDDANSFKQFREFFLVAHTFNDFLSNIYITFEIDYADVNSNIKIANQISVWGRSVFGDRFITRNINASVPFVIGRRGRNLRFIVSNGYYLMATVPLITGLETFINPKVGGMVFVTENSTYYVYENGDWISLLLEDLNQPMRVYQVNGEYEFRGKR
jgi:hypothetical protein